MLPSRLHLGAVGPRLGALGLRRLAVVHRRLVAAPRPPSAHVEVAVAVLTGTFRHWKTEQTLHQKIFWQRRLLERHMSYFLFHYSMPSYYFGLTINATIK